MKKTLLVIGSIAALLVALAVAGFAYAQAQTPPTPAVPGQGYGGYGPGMMGGWYNGQGQTGPAYGRMGRGMMGGWGGPMTAGYGPMHTYMVDAFAQVLGLDAADLQARLEAGETMWDIALAEGLSEEQAWDAMEQAHDAALEAAVAGGVLSQEQADWMESHMDRMYSGGYGPGAGCHGYGAPSDGQTSSPRPGSRWNNG